MSSHTLTTAPSRQRVRPLAAAAVGNVVEWFDLTIYATFAVYFAPPLFFPSADPAAALLSTFAVFAVGFFVRPLWMAPGGAYADRQGRKKALTLTIVLMAAPDLRCRTRSDICLHRVSSSDHPGTGQDGSGFCRGR